MMNLKYERYEVFPKNGLFWTLDKKTSTVLHFFHRRIDAEQDVQQRNKGTKR